MRESILSFLDDYTERGEAQAFAYRKGLRIERWSYGRVAALARKVARELEVRRVVKGDRVLLRAENSPLWVAAFFGCALRGVVIVPMDAETDADFLERVREQTGPKLLIHDRVEESLATGGLAALSLTTVEERGAHHVGEHERETVGTGDLLEIIYTSGTTTEPKGVLLTHGNLLANLAPLESEIQKYLKWERLVHPLRFLNTLPLSHVFGQLMTIFVPGLLGGEVFFQHSLNPSEIVETCARERSSVMVTVPRVLELLRDYVERTEEKKDAAFHQALERAEGWSIPRRLWAFRSAHKRFGWKFWAFISGGATLRESTENFWQRLGFAVIQGYGMTETASLISVNHPFKKSRGSIGRTLEGQEVKLGEAGEILVRGANVSPGYWTGDAMALRSEDGWLATGDVGELDAQGNLYFKGRKKEVIVTAAGLNIYPEDLEAALNAQSEVRESVVIAFESEHGPEPLAVLIMRNEGAAAAEAISRANQSLAKHQRIRRHLIWPERDFPRTLTQKVIRREVAQRARMMLANSTQAAESRGTLAEIINRINGQKAAATAKHASGLATDLNLDSLGRVELLSTIEERYQIELDEATFTSATTLGDVERMIRESRARDETAAAAEAKPYPYPEWARKPPLTWIRRLALYLFVLPLTSLMCWVKVRGGDNLQGLKAPVLFVSNHISMVDHALILSALPGRFRRHLAIAMEGEILRDWVHAPAGTNWLTRARLFMQYLLVVTLFNVFPLPKKSGFRRSFHYAGEMMDRGSSVLVFPEGARSDDGRMNSFMTGTGLLARGLGAPVVPIRIDGLAELKLKNRHAARPGQVKISFGRALRFSSEDEPAQISARLEQAVREL